MSLSPVPFSLGLVASCPDGLTVVAERCTLRTEARQRVLLFGGLPVFSFEVGDPTGLAYAMVLIDQSGFATQLEIARAFDVTTRTVQRNVVRYREGGAAALGRPRGWKKGFSRLPHGLQARAAQLKRKRLSNERIALLLGVSPPSVAKLLRAEGVATELVAAPAQVPLGLEETNDLASCKTTPAAEPMEEAIAVPLPVEAEGSKPEPAEEAGARTVSELAGVLQACAERVEEAEHAPGEEGQRPATETSADAGSTSVGVSAPHHAWSFSQDPADRSFDRALAAAGLLEDAIPMFRQGSRISGAGVLLAVPVLAASGVLDVAREVYGSLAPAFYGLRTTFVTLLLMALLRIKRPEWLKERCPRDLGRILGLDRAPEVKTLRRKLHVLSGKGRAMEMIQRMAKHRVEQQSGAVGFLYVDGHVRVYHGEKTLPKAHVARMRLSLPATTDYWVNDAAGDPVFAVTANANAGLVKVLPALLPQMKSLLGGRRLTVVFDRGGYSPALFRSMVDAKVDILTYRKGAFRKVRVKDFKTYAGTKGGRPVEYELADQQVRLGNKRDGWLLLRQVTRRSKNGHQTPILTSRRDLTAVEVAERMFDRWQQENFFKYMREEFALDALVTYAAEADDPERDVPNPKRAQLDKKVAAAKAELKKLQAEYGQNALANPEGSRPTMRGFKIANGRIGQALREAMRGVAELMARRAKVPARIPVRERTNGEPVVKLHAEMGRLQNLLKMVACQAESDLVRIVAPHYSRALEEGRTLIQAALTSPADLVVDRDALTVVLAAQSSPHRSAAIQVLCDELNETESIFPGTTLRLRFAVATGPSGTWKPDRLR